jgi:hypothetical protein
MITELSSGGDMYRMVRAVRAATDVLLDRLDG